MHRFDLIMCLIMYLIISGRRACRRLARLIDHRAGITRCRVREGLTQVDRHIGRDIAFLDHVGDFNRPQRDAEFRALPRDVEHTTNHAPGSE